MNYVSVCSGIEAASVAWEPLGWNPVAFAETDKFASAVLKKRFPQVPNVGDFTQIRGDEFGTVDVLVGGTPCQDFSVAGLRAGLDGQRGQLTIEFARLAGRLRSRWLVWENVPGVLSSDGGRAFGIFLGLLGELGYGFAYRVLDAQYAGVPQRRRRVFVVGHLGDWRRAAVVLFERHSLSGHPPPRRQAGQGVAGTLKGGVGERGWPDPSDGNGGGLIDVPCFWDGGQTSQTLDAVLAKQQMMPEKQRFPAVLVPGTSATCPTLGARKNETGGDRPPGTDVDTCESLVVTHSLRAEGFDASEDGTGRGTPLVPVAAHTTGAGFWQEGLGTLRSREQDSHENLITFDTTLITSKTNRSNPQPGDPSHPLTEGGHPPTIAFSSKDYGADVGETSPTLRAMEFDKSHANAGGQVAIAFCGMAQGGAGWAPPSCPTSDDCALPLDTTRAQAVAFQSSQSGVREAEAHATLDSNNGSRRQNGVVSNMAVRRLTPMECERLQGFPDNYTKIGSKTADGPRYRVLGNSMAVPVMAWIGKRIQEVDAL